MGGFICRFDLWICQRSDLDQIRYLDLMSIRWMYRKSTSLVEEQCVMPTLLLRRGILRGGAG